MMQRDINEIFLETLTGYSSHILSNLPNQDKAKSFYHGRNGSDFAIAGNFRLQVKPKYVEDKTSKIDEIGIYHVDEVLDYSYATIRTLTIETPLEVEISNLYFNRKIDSKEFRQGEVIEIINPTIRYEKESQSFILIGGKQKDIGKLEFYLDKAREFLELNEKRELVPRRIWNGKI